MTSLGFFSSFFWEFFLVLAVFLLNGAAVVEARVDILSVVSMGHIIENARLVNVDSAATVLCEQAIDYQR